MIFDQYDKPPPMCSDRRAEIEGVIGSRKRRTQRGEEPSVLAAGVALLQHLLDVLLGILPLCNLLEGVVCDGTLETLKLQSVTGGHQVVVVDDLDEGLDLGALLLAGLGHAAGDLGRVALDTGNDGVAVRVRLVTRVDGLDDDNLNQRKATVSEFCSLFPPRIYRSVPPRM